MLALLSVWSKVQTCIWPSWCHCRSLSLASVKSRLVLPLWLLVLPFWYRLTRVILDKGSLNGCVCVYSVELCVCIIAADAGDDHVTTADNEDSSAVLAHQSDTSRQPHTQKLPVHSFFGQLLTLYYARKVAHTWLLSVRFRGWSRFLAVSLQVMCHKPGGRLPLLFTRPAITPATLKRAATNFAAWWTEARWVWAVCLRLLPDNVVTAIEPRPFCAWVQHANHSATKPPFYYASYW